MKKIVLSFFLIFILVSFLFIFFYTKNINYKILDQNKALEIALTEVKEKKSILYPYGQINGKGPFNPSRISNDFYFIMDSKKEDKKYLVIYYKNYMWCDIELKNVNVDSSKVHVEFQNKKNQSCDNESELIEVIELENNHNNEYLVEVVGKSKHQILPLEELLKKLKENKK